MNNGLTRHHHHHHGGTPRVLILDSHYYNYAVHTSIHCLGVGVGVEESQWSRNQNRIWGGGGGGGGRTNYSAQLRTYFMKF